MGRSEAGGRAGASTAGLEAPALRQAGCPPLRGTGARRRRGCTGGAQQDGQAGGRGLLYAGTVWRLGVAAGHRPALRGEAVVGSWVFR